MLLTCPHCSGQSSVPDQTAAANVHCPHCSGEIPLAITATPVYATAYTEPGYAEPFAPAGPGWGAQSASPRVLACTSCGGTFNSDQIVDQEGLILCHPCYERRAAAAHEAAAKADSHSGIEVKERCAGCGSAFPHSQLHETPQGLLCEACAGHPLVGETGNGHPADADAAPIDEAAGHHADAVVSDDSFHGAGGDVINMTAPTGGTSTYLTRPRKQSDPLKIVLGAAAAAIVVVGGLVIYSLSGDESKPAVNQGTVAIVKPFETVKPATQTASTGGSKVVLNDWEKRNGPQLLSLQRQAKARNDRKDFDGASQTYEQLFLLLDENKGSVQDPQLKQAVESARTEWNAVRSKLGMAPAEATTGPTKTPPSGTDAGGPSFTQGNKPLTAETTKQIERLLSEADFATKQGNKGVAFTRYKDLSALLHTERPRVEDKTLLARITTAFNTRDDLGEELRNRPDSADATIDALLKQGLSYLSAGKWQAGFESLADVKLYTERRIENADKIRSDAAYVNALHGMAVSYISTNQPAKAAAMFDDAATLGILAKTKPTRELLWNQAVADIAQKTTAMRTVTALRAYLDTDKEKVDEQMLNLFGTAIAAAFGTSASDPKLAEAVEYYKTRNADLEKTRPGAMHWGVKWLEAEAAKAMQEKRDSSDKILKVKKHALDDVRAKLEQVLKGERVAINKGKSKIYVQRVNEDLLKATKADEAVKVKEYNDARAQTPRAEWLADLKPMIPGTGQFAGATTKPMDPAAGDKVRRYAAAFPIDRYRLVTAVAPIGAATKVRLEDVKGNVIFADVVHKGAKLAILEVSPADVGKGLKFFSIAIGSSGGKLRCASLAVPSIYGPKPEMIDGGKDNKASPAAGPWVVSFEQHPRLPGAPILEGNGVVGVELAGRDDAKEKIPTATLSELTNLLDSVQGTPTEEGSSPDPLSMYQVVVEGD